MKAKKEKIKSTSEVDKKIGEFLEPKKHKNNFLYGAWFKFLLSLCIYGISLFIIFYLFPKLENSIVGNENWAIALIAIPIALLGIYISVALELSKKMNIKVLGISVKDMYHKIDKIADYQFGAWMSIAMYSIAWVICFIYNDYKQMIAIALFMSIWFIYLIIYSIWICFKDPIYLYCKSIINNKIEKSNIFNNDQKISNVIIKEINDEEFDNIYKYVKQTYANIFDTIDQLMVEILYGQNQNEAKEIFYYILNELKHIKFSELNIAIISSIAQKSSDLSEAFYKSNETMFLHKTTLLIQKISNDYMKNALKFLKEFLIIFNDKHTLELLKNDSSTTIEKCLCVLYKISYFYKILDNTYIFFKAIYIKISNEENFLQKFNNYKIDVDNLNENKELLSKLNNATKRLVDVLKSLNKNHSKIEGNIKNLI